MSIPSTPDPITARAQAAALFAAAARHESAGPTSVLHCLAALTVLREPTYPTPPTDATDPDRLIEQALQLLGGLPAEEFARADVLEAARYGRRALRELR